MHAFFHVQYGLNAYIWHVKGFGDVNITKATTAPGNIILVSEVSF